jgi:hypothetical protein
MKCVYRYFQIPQLNETPSFWWDNRKPAINQMTISVLINIYLDLKDNVKKLQKPHKHVRQKSSSCLSLKKISPKCCVAIIFLIANIICETELEKLIMFKYSPFLGDYSQCVLDDILAKWSSFLKLQRASVEIRKLYVKTM